MSNILIACLLCLVLLSPSSVPRLPEVISLSTPPNVSHLLYTVWSSSWSKSHKIVGPLYDWIPLELLTLRLFHTESPATHQLQFRFSCLALGSAGVSALCLCSCKLWLSVFAHLPHPSWGKQLDVSSPLLWSKKTWFFSLFRFLLLLGWQLPSSEHEEPETGSRLHIVSWKHSFICCQHSVLYFYQFPVQKYLPAILMW